MGDNVSARLTTVQRDRACGVLLGTAAGEALGAAKGGEWIGGTAMAIAVAELAAIQVDLRRDVIQDRIVERWDWRAKTVKRIGGRPASLARTASVALAHLDAETALATAARAISDLIHHDPDVGDTSVLWCAAIRHAVLTGQLDIRIGLGQLDTERRQQWAERLDAAAKSPPSTFTADDGAVAALQAAWSTIVHTPVPVDEPAKEVFRVDHLRLTLEAAAIAGAGPAAIAGGLLGATYGASAVPSDWRLGLRGWPGLRTRDLIRLADNIIDKGDPERRGGYWATEDQPPPRRHPHDEQLWIGGVGALARPRQYVPDGVDAIVSLCPVSDTWLRTGATHLDVRLGDEEDEKPNLDFVLLDTVRAVEQLRATGRTVFLHSMHARNRTPAVAALYGARKRGIGIDEALHDVAEVLPDANPAGDLRAALHRLADAA